MITITEQAKSKVNDILYDEGKPEMFLRAFVQGGGCAGFSYGFMLDQTLAEDDFEFETGPFKVVVDAMSMQYLEGATIDYKEELLGSSFTISNPNSVSQCGCGSSFSI